jgi:hypothetical protein
MGLKGYRLWVMGQLDSNVQSPTAAASRLSRVSNSAATAEEGGGASSNRVMSASRAVAVQVAFERQTLKPVFHLIGYSLWV